VIDFVGDGHDSTSTRSLKTLRPGGIIIAVPSGGSQGLLGAAPDQGLRASNFLVEPDGAALARIAALIDSGTVTVGLDDVLPLEKAADAHRRGEAGETRGKLVLSVVS
jgi:NADPH:quinone reductase-like Zn-dependent oxidoreductase